MCSLKLRYRPTEHFSRRMLRNPNPDTNGKGGSLPIYAVIYASLGSQHRVLLSSFLNVSLVQREPGEHVKSISSDKMVLFIASESLKLLQGRAGPRKISGGKIDPSQTKKGKRGFVQMAVRHRVIDKFKKNGLSVIHSSRNTIRMRNIQQGARAHARIWLVAANYKKLIRGSFGPPHISAG